MEDHRNHHVCHRNGSANRLSNKGATFVRWFWKVTEWLVYLFLIVYPFLVLMTLV